MPTDPPTDKPTSDEKRDKPLEEAQKSYHTILEQQIAQAAEELDRPALGLLLSGLAAGLDVGFGPLAMAAQSTLTKGVIPHAVQELINALLYAIGFVIVILGRSELFTEHTTSAVLPVVDGRAPLWKLLRVWGLVLVANLVGVALFSAAAAWLGPAMDVAKPEAFGQMARKLVEKPSGVMFVSAIAAGWLMGLVAWLTTAARDTIGQIVIILLVTGVIGLLGLHHSIAGSAEVLLGVFVGEGATIGDFARFLGIAVAGNAIGGATFVGLLKHGHVRQS